MQETETARQYFAPLAEIATSLTVKSFSALTM